MVITCAALGCTNRQDKNHPEIGFHRFPLRKTHLLKRWIASVRRKNWQPTKYSYLCSLHFMEQDFTLNFPGRRHKLKKDAVPSIFTYLNLEESCGDDVETDSSSELYSFSEVDFKHLSPVLNPSTIITSGSTVTTVCSSAPESFRAILPNDSDVSSIKNSHVFFKASFERRLKCLKDMNIECTKKIKILNQRKLRFRRKLEYYISKVLALNKNGVLTNKFLNKYDNGYVRSLLETLIHKST